MCKLKKVKYNIESLLNFPYQYHGYVTCCPVFYLEGFCMVGFNQTWSKEPLALAYHVLCIA